MTGREESAEITPAETGERQPSAPRRPNFWLVALGIWLVLRMLVIVPSLSNPELVRMIDNNTYLELAETLVARGAFQGVTREELDLVRTPVYPLFAAGVLAASEGNLAFLALAQLGLTILTCALIYKTAKMAFSPTAAIAAAWLYALDPNSLTFALAGLTETFFALLLTLAVYFLVRYRRDGGWGWALAAGLAIGLAALTRPIGALLIPVWALFALLSRPQAPRRTRIVKSLVLLGFGMLVIVPWQLRNLAVYDQYTLSPVGEKTIRNWMLAKGVAYGQGITREEAVVQISEAMDQGASLLDIFMVDPKPVLVAQVIGVYKTLVGFEYGTIMVFLDIERQPGREFVNASLARNLPRAWRAAREMLAQGYYIQLAVPLWAFLYDLILYALVFSGLISMIRGRKNLWLAALLVIVPLYLILGPGAAGEARFRVPAAPLLAIMGGVGLSGWLALVRRLQRTDSSTGVDPDPGI